MTNLVSPPPLQDVNALVELMKLVSDPEAIAAKLQELQEVSAKIYSDLRDTATANDAMTARSVGLDEKEVSLGNREAAIAQREVALHDAENALAAKVAALRNLVG